jgi:hypothetical protein
MQPGETVKQLNFKPVITKNKWCVNMKDRKAAFARPCRAVLL